MPRPSKIDRLPAEIREKISGLREDGYTIDEILIHLGKLAINPDSLPSRSGLHRHVQGLDKIAERLRHHRVVADALVRRLGDAPEGRQTRLNIELMHTIVTDLMTASGPESEDGEPGEPVQLDAAQVHFLAKSLDHLSRASAKDAELTLRIRAEAEKRTKAAAVDAAESVGREKGLSAETVEAIKARILGVTLDSDGRAPPANPRAGHA
jgi:hypothetical protein